MDLSLRQKAELNKILHGYGQVLKELENAGEALEEAFEENGSCGSSLVEAVRAFIQTFRLALDQAKKARLTKREATKEVVDVDR